MSRHFAYDIFRHFDTNFALDIFVVFRHVLTTLPVPMKKELESFSKQLSQLN